MARTVRRSTISGRFISKAAAARWPSTSMAERVGAGTGNARTAYRSAITGRFIKGPGDPGTTTAHRV